MNDRSVQVQAEVRRNAEEQVDVLKDLGAWEASMKMRDEEIKLKRAEERFSIKSGESAPDSFVTSPCAEMPFDIREKAKNGQTVIVNGVPQAPCIAVEVATARNPKIISCSSKEGESTSKNIEEEERLRGNSFYSNGNYAEAIKCYTKCLMMNNHSSAVVFSNRAMAYLKLKDWQRAEADSSSALNLDPKHLKSYQRRASARFRLGKIRAAINDIEKAECVLEGCGMNERTLLSLKKTLAQEKKKFMDCLHDIIRKAPRRRIPIVVQEVDTTKNDGSEVKLERFLNVMEVKELPLPKTWYEFEATWKTLSCNDKVAYLERIKPAALLALYRNGIEDVQLLSELITSASDCKNANSFLHSICRIPSLDMVALMLTTEQREAIALVLDIVERDSKYQHSELRALILK
mmetsp:Transcript_11091/g.16794  ORF Transcript_11091/g.16794 Transcript_11091/m.16794 type:complete len:405 (-) Transcript_11091:123-1337(-)